MMTLVTGASGHIGANLVRALLAKNCGVRVLVHRDRRAFEGLAIEECSGDILDTDSLKKAFEGIQVVYHLATRISLRRRDPMLMQTNIEGTRNVIEACLRTKARLVHFSSIHAIAQHPYDRAVDEDRPLTLAATEFAYEKSKILSEKLVREAIEDGLDAVVLSPTGVIGPWDFGPSHMGDALTRFARQKTVALIRGGYNWVDVRDVASAAISAARQASPGARFILAGHFASFAEIAGAVAAWRGMHMRKLLLPQWLAEVGIPIVLLTSTLSGKRPLYTRMSLQTIREANPAISHDRATRELGFSPRSLNVTLVDTLNWFVEYGLIRPPISYAATNDHTTCR